MFKLKRAILLFLIMGFGGGDHSHPHDRHPSQSKVRKWSTFIHRKNHFIELSWQLSPLYAGLFLFD